MLRFTLLSLSIILVSVVLFGSKIHTVRLNSVDKVSAAETFMNER